MQKYATQLNIRDEKTRGNKSENQFKDVCGDIKKMLGHLANCMEKTARPKGIIAML